MISRIKKLLFLVGKNGRIKFFILLVAMVINSLFEMAGIGIIPVFLIGLSSPDKLLHHKWAGPVLTWLNINDAKNMMLWGSLFLVGVFLAKNSFFSIFVYIKGKVVYNQQLRLGNRLFKAYMKAPYTFFLSRNSAELLRNVNGETKVIVGGIIIPMLEIILDTLVLGMIIILLLAVEPLISLVSFAVLGGLSLIFVRITNKKNKAYGKEAQIHRRISNKIVLEGISGIKDIMVMGRENSFLVRYNFSSSRTVISLRYKQLISQLPKPFMETIAVTGILSITLMLLALGRPVNSLIPVLALFGVATMRMLPTLKNCISAYTDIRYNVYAIDPVYDDLKSLEKDADRRLKKEKIIKVVPYPFATEIVFRNVSYRYPQGNVQAINNISLNIARGKSIGFAGHSGAGKTTIVDIILGLLEPQQGQVLVDNQNIYEDVRRWQMNVGYIPQFIYLSDDTIRRNIALGLPDEEIEETRLLESLRAAQMESLIAELPKGLDTVVGERGVRLSGGQRQRIGIARALYNNPQVLIMDEATSALDNITEKSVIEAIENLRGDRTIIMIAHRLTTVRNCDVLYFMEAGKIVDEGSYQELLQKNEKFKAMAMDDGKRGELNS
jgi:ATP-binding cassette subfamily C protein